VRFVYVIILCNNHTTFTNVVFLNVFVFTNFMLTTSNIGLFFVTLTTLLIDLMR